MKCHTSSSSKCGARTLLWKCLVRGKSEEGVTHLSFSARRHTPPLHHHCTVEHPFPSFLDTKDTTRHPFVRFQISSSQKAACVAKGQSYQDVWERVGVSERARCAQSDYQTSLRVQRGVLVGGGELHSTLKGSGCVVSRRHTQKPTLKLGLLLSSRSRPTQRTQHC